MPPYFIDFEAFRYKKEKFLIKELAMVDVDKPLTPIYFIFNAKTGWQQLTSDQKLQFKYQSNHIHHLRWNEGVSRYCKACVWHHMKTDFPLCESAITYVMGKEKMTFLKQQFPKLRLVEYNITFKALPDIPKTIMCVHREHGEHCAYRKTLRLFHHYTTINV